MERAATETVNLIIEPDHDVKEELVKYFITHDFKIGVVATCIGLLKKTQLRVLGTNRLLKLRSPVELLNASGLIKKEKNSVKVNLNVIVGGKSLQVYAGKLYRGCIAMKPEGVTILLVASRKDQSLDLRDFR